MPYSKRIVCLANSRKFSGRCIAGLEVTRVGDLGEWVRPVSVRESEELSIDERRYEDGKDVRVLDIVEIRFREPRPHACQTENHVIDDEYYWVRQGTFDPPMLIKSAKTSPPLWIDGFSSFSGENDRIPLTAADRLADSLKLLNVDRYTIRVAQGMKKRQVRILFSLGKVNYCLGVTDPKIEAEYLAKPDDDYPNSSEALLCVSLGEPFEGYRYKLAAGVILL